MQRGGWWRAGEGVGGNRSGGTGWRADFLINVTMDEAKALTGVFAGHWRPAFERATASLVEAVTVPALEPYDVVTVDTTINLLSRGKGLQRF